MSVACPLDFFWMSVSVGFFLEDVRVRVRLLRFFLEHVRVRWIFF
jgi:hypothetical protein